jgi:inner membrane protein
VEGPSHVVFGVAGAVALDSALHLSGPALLGAHTTITPDLVGLKVIFYGFAALGALAPDIDNARSTIGKRMGIISREIQKHAGHRTFFHSIVGLVFVGALGWATQQGIARLLLRVGWPHTAEALLANEALKALLVGYALHIVADGLTLGGVPLLWPWHERFGFPPVRKMRFRTGSVWEPIVVVGVSVAVIVGIFTHVLTV